MVRSVDVNIGTRKGTLHDSSRDLNEEGSVYYGHSSNTKDFENRKATDGFTKTKREFFIVIWDNICLLYTSRCV